MIETLNQQNEQLKSELKRKGNEASQIMAKMTENRDQPCKQCLVIQNEKERLLERVEELEGKLHREVTDLQETISELKQDKEELGR